MSENRRKDSRWVTLGLFVFIVTIIVLVSVCTSEAAVALEGSFKTIALALPDSIGIDTKTGSNRLLVVMASIENSNSPYGLSDVIIGPRASGASLVQAGKQKNSQDVAFCEIWYATESQISAMSVDSIYFTRTGSALSSSWAISISMWSGVDQTELVTDSAQDSKTGAGDMIDSMLTDVAVNDLLIAVAQNGNGAVSHDWTLTNAWTETYDAIGSSMTGSGAYFIADATQDSVHVSPGGSGRGVLLAMCFRAATAGGADPSTRRRKALLGQ